MFRCVVLGVCFRSVVRGVRFRRCCVASSCCRPLSVPLELELDALLDVFVVLHLRDVDRHVALQLRQEAPKRGSALLLVVLLNHLKEALRRLLLIVGALGHRAERSLAAGSNEKRLHAGPKDRARGPRDHKQKVLHVNARAKTRRVFTRIVHVILAARGPLNQTSVICLPQIGKTIYTHIMGDFPKVIFIFFLN